mmetsp:Transcript_4534/g.7413  ORF Transcript_4534/g.7413 Transcript_4534/m.7413 type:complete len:372 (+) Transcript_4534:85-1200(+)
MVNCGLTRMPSASNFEQLVSSTRNKEELDTSSVQLHIEKACESQTECTHAMKNREIGTGALQKLPNVVGKQLFRVLLEKVRSNDEDEPGWDAILSQNAVFDGHSRSELRHFYDQLRTSIIVMDPCSTRAQRLLETFDGKLCDVSSVLIEEMRDDKPMDLGAAKVGDFNENLSYAMQDGRGLLSVIQQARMNQGMEGAVRESSPHLLQEVARFEAALQEAVGDSSGIIEYQGSFMKTDTTIPQPPHVDFKWELLQEEKDRFFIAFFPLTDEGMFLQLWPNRCKTETTSGFIVYIPQGKLLMVPSDTVHGGGFKAGENGNLRFHLYVASGGASLPITHTNKYTEEDDPTKEMSDRLIDSSCLKELVGPFFDNY